MLNKHSPWKSRLIVVIIRCMTITRTLNTDIISFTNEPYVPTSEVKKRKAQQKKKVMFQLHRYALLHSIYMYFRIFAVFLLLSILKSIAISHFIPIVAEGKMKSLKIMFQITWLPCFKLMKMINQSHKSIVLDLP